MDIVDTADNTSFEFVVPIAAVAAVVASYSYSRAWQMLDFFLDSYKTIGIWRRRSRRQTGSRQRWKVFAAAV